jgi:AraC family transcriptional regulator
VALTLERGEFFGRTLQRRAAAGLTMAEVLYSPNTSLPRHSHERAYFCLILRGRYSENYGRRTRVCRPLTLAYHPPGEPHSQMFADRAVSSFNVEIGAEALFQASNTLGYLDQPFEYHGGAVAALGQQLHREFRRPDTDSVAVIESLTLEILAATQACARFDGKQPRWLVNAKEAIDSRFREPLTLGALAREAGVHSIHFASVFRRVHCCSVGEYMRRRRLDYARRKLSDPELSLAQIAIDAGFADQSHLTRNFKRLTGKTPGEYRTFLRFKTA